MCTLKDFEHLKLDPAHRQILEGELEMWHQNYLPSFSLEGKTVLDAGAGNGETAQFYLNHGAERVISIDPDASLLYENFGKNPKVIIVPHPINFVKLDIEGGEEDLTVETHFICQLKHFSNATSPTAPAVNLWRLEKMRLTNGVFGHPFIQQFHDWKIQVAHGIKGIFRAWIR